MNAVYGCAGCSTTAGAGVCPVHGKLNKLYPLHPTPESKTPLTDAMRRILELKDEEIARLKFENSVLETHLRDLIAVVDQNHHLTKNGERLVGHTGCETCAIIERGSKKRICVCRPMSYQAGLDGNCIKCKLPMGTRKCSCGADIPPSRVEMCERCHQGLQS